MQSSPRNPVVQLFAVAVDRVNQVVLVVLSLVLGALACLGLAQVVWRYLLGSPLTWSEEIIRYTLIWTVFLGAGVAVRKGLLASVELVSQLAPEPVRKALGYLALFICGLFWAALMVYGFIVLQAVRGMLSGALEMPMPMVYLAIPVGAALALLNTIAAVVAPVPPPLYLD